MKASGWLRELAPCASCRRGSSRPLSDDDGSTASTARRWPWRDEVQAERLDERRLADAGRAADADAHRRCRCAAAARRAAPTASARWSARVDSTMVIARASARRSPPLDARRSAQCVVPLSVVERAAAPAGPRARPRRSRAVLAHAPQPVQRVSCRCAAGELRPRTGRARCRSSSIGQSSPMS